MAPTISDDTTLFCPAFVSEETPKQRNRMNPNETNARKTLKEIETYTEAVNLATQLTELGFGGWLNTNVMAKDGELLIDNLQKDMNL